jgi:2-dehydropantoate 2-reductase
MEKIIIAGIGGVGGYFGGLLAKHFYPNEKFKIFFFARGKHLEAIKQNGLLVIQDEKEFIAKPDIATNDAREIGIADLIIISTKSYDLERVIQQLKPSINEYTILLPLLNGVDSKEKIQNKFPKNTVLDGCVYIVSRLKQPGIVENKGNIHKLYFGLDNSANGKLRHYERIFREANIEATFSDNISKVIWEKFIFLSPIATTTSYYDKCIGEVLEDKECFESLIGLIEEVKQLAKAKQIIVSVDIKELTLKKLNALPFETTSSMHSDFKTKKNNTELKSLTGYVIEEGKKYNIDTPNYKKAYSKLQKHSI